MNSMREIMTALAKTNNYQKMVNMYLNRDATLEVIRSMQTIDGQFEAKIELKRKQDGQLKTLTSVVVKNANKDTAINNAILCMMLRMYTNGLLILVNICLQK